MKNDCWPTRGTRTTTAVLSSRSGVSRMNKIRNHERSLVYSWDRETRSWPYENDTNQNSRRRQVAWVPEMELVCHLPVVARQGTPVGRVVVLVAVMDARIAWTDLSFLLVATHDQVTPPTRRRRTLILQWKNSPDPLPWTTFESMSILGT